jgi:hypothetical protein
MSIGDRRVALIVGVSRLSIRRPKGWPAQRAAGRWAEGAPELEYDDTRSFVDATRFRFRSRASRTTVVVASCRSELAS